MTTRSIFFNGAQVSAGTVTDASSIAIGLGSLAGVRGISIGNSSGFRVTGATNTVALGRSALGSATTSGALDNVAIGQSAGLVCAGYYNVFIGKTSGNSCTTGSKNVFIGLNANTSSSGQTEAIAIGQTAVVTSGIASISIGKSTSSGYGIAIGNAATSTSAYCSLVGTANSVGGRQLSVHSSHKLVCIVSSRLFKKDIEPLPDLREAVLSLEPVQFQWNIPDNAELDGGRDFGLIAEDVLGKVPDLAEMLGPEPRSVRYDMLAVYLLQVVKNQTARIAALEAIKKSPA